MRGKKAKQIRRIVKAAEADTLAIMDGDFAPSAEALRRARRRTERLLKRTSKQAPR